MWDDLFFSMTKKARSLLIAALSCLLIPRDFHYNNRFNNAFSATR
jgi:hypothetical protein